MSDEVTWVALKDVHKQYGYTSLEAARNAVAASRFPVPTFKLNRMIAIDKAVHEAFFQRHREQGLSALKNNTMVSGQQAGSDDAKT